MDSRSQQPMINLSSSGRKRNKENQSDASLAVSVDKVLVMLWIYSYKDAPKALRDPGPSGLRQSSTVTAEPRVMSLYQLLIRMHHINCTIRRALLSNFDQNADPGFVLDSTVTSVMPSTNAATGRAPLTGVGQNASNQCRKRNKENEADNFFSGISLTMASNS
ncbi:hypothetical protein ACET3Z_031751 [Daucus carota]